MATHSSILAGRIPMDREAWQAAVHRVSQIWTRLKWLSPHSSSFSMNFPLLSSWREKFCLLGTQVFGCGGEENELKETELEGAWYDCISQNPGGKQMAHSGWGIEKSLIEGLFTEEWAGFKGATQRCGSIPGLITPVSWYLLQPPAARSRGCRCCCWNPGWQLSREGPQGEKNLTLLSSLPSTSCQDSPLAPLSWKPENKGAWWYHPFRSASEQATKQDSGGGWRGDGGCPAQHVSENIDLSRQEEEWETLPEPCRQRKRGAGVFRESRRSLNDRSLCCCCCCWCVCVCVWEREREREKVRITQSC